MGIKVTDYFVNRPKEPRPERRKTPGPRILSKAEKKWRKKKYKEWLDAKERAENIRPGVAPVGSEPDEQAPDTRGIPINRKTRKTRGGKVPPKPSAQEQGTYRSRGGRPKGSTGIPRKKPPHERSGRKKRQFDPESLKDIPLEEFHRKIPVFSSSSHYKAVCDALLYRALQGDITAQKAKAMIGAVKEAMQVHLVNVQVALQDLDDMQLPVWFEEFMGRVVNGDLKEAKKIVDRQVTVMTNQDGKQVHVEKVSYESFDDEYVEKVSPDDPRILEQIPEEDEEMSKALLPL
jgi:hypothetical protein